MTTTVKTASDKLRQWTGASILLAALALPAGGQVGFYPSGELVTDSSYAPPPARPTWTIPGASPALVAPATVPWGGQFVLVWNTDVPSAWGGLPDPRSFDRSECFIVCEGVIVGRFDLGGANAWLWFGDDLVAFPGGSLPYVSGLPAVGMVPVPLSLLVVQRAGMTSLAWQTEPRVFVLP